MKSFQQSYSNSIGRVARIENGKPIPTSIAEDAARVQVKINWLESTITQEIFSSIKDRVRELEDQARILACSYHQHNNHQQILSLLIRADEIRKIVDSYASAK